MPQPPSARGESGPQEQQRYRGVAQVHNQPPPRFQDTADLPVVEPTPPEPWRANGATRPAPPRGMIVRRRWRRLRSGAGWTWTGLTIVVVCWGIWAISVRGTDLVGPVLGLGLVLATGGLLFVVAQVIGRHVWDRVLQRPRVTAWPSHLTVCVFFTMVGITFLQQTWWVQGSWKWLGDTWQWLRDSWQWLVDLWPL